MSTDRTAILEAIRDARLAGAKQRGACAVAGISAKTFQRWSSENNTEDGRINTKHEPSNKLTELERQRIIKVANEPAYAALAPGQIVPILADKGHYIASESSFYRVLKAENLLQHRQRSKPRNPAKKPRPLVASGPNQIYTWDITYLPTAVHGVYLYLYLVLDIFSRKIVGWQVHDQELSALAADLITDICRREGVKRHQVTLHSDNGSPMKGATMLATLQQLGVMPSFSRPSVSDDNPYSESLFRTLKYCAAYPVDRPFEDLAAARSWVESFTTWYNVEHRHSAIKFVTPAQRHSGEDIQILKNRARVYENAKLAHPKRWSGSIRNWEPIKEVYLNPGNEKIKKDENKAA